MNTVYIDSDTMRQYGIDFLTGEACALSMRQLCEIDEAMMRTYLAYTGIQTSIREIAKSQYNNRNKYSVFLTHEVIEDLIIMRLMEENQMVVEILPREQQGFSMRKHLLVGQSDEIREYLKRHFDTDGTGTFYQIGRTYAIYEQQPRRGFSNIHGFTGISQ